MAKLTRSALSSLSKQDLIEYTDQLQEETKGGWHGGQLTAILAALLVGFLGGRVLAQGSLKLAKPNPAQPAENEATATPKPSATKQLKQWAKDLGLDTGKFNKCLDSNKYAQAVKDDFDAGSKVGVQGTPGFFINGRPIKGAQPFENFKKVIDEELERSGPADSQGRVEVGVGTLPAKGDKSAPVTMIEFSDFQCPFCARFYQQTFPQLKREYISTGKVVFYYRDFPLSSLHPNAQKAAEAARCANDQNAFWKYHDKIFENQRSLS